MTVCVAARCGGILLGASDRMLTSGDIQFEPPATAKTVAWTRSIVVMQAGDAAFHTEIVREVFPIIEQAVKERPTEWWFVKDVVDLYVKHRNLLKLKKAEAAILAPLGLDRNTFIGLQKEMNPGIAEQLTRDLINFEVPNVSVIFVGNDLLGPHIYVVADGEVSCNDVVGFAAIGIGARHAESLFMMEKHWWNATISDTALLAYTAKKRSEIAPGVGEATDMFTIGPALGTYYVLDEERMQKLEAIYKKMKLSEARSTKRGRKEAKDYVEELQARTAREEEARAQSEPPTQQSSPPSEAGPKGSTNGGKTAPGGEKTEGKDT